MASKKVKLLNYPRFFLFQAIFYSISWLFFLFLFIVVGKKCVDIDFLGKIYEFFFGKERSFIQYFVGVNNSEKIKILDYAIYFVLAIIALNFVSILFNYYFWKKDKYIENNKFYLHNRGIFIINSLIHISCAFLLTFSFVSAFTVVLTLLFISFNTWTHLPKSKSKIPQTEEFFSWKNEYVRQIFFYSIFIVFIVPFIFGRFKDFYDKAMGESPEGLAKTFKELINSNDTVKSIVELIIGANFNFFHWFVLIWFVKSIISERVKEFNDFWIQINSINEKAINYRHYYYYQESWANINNTSINLGNYNYLKNSPNFLSQNYLEGDLRVEDFAKKNKKVVKYIEFCEDKVKETNKKNFLLYSLFNEFNSWEDCVRNKDLIIRTIR